MIKKIDSNRILYVLLLIAGFFGLIFTAISDAEWGSGLSTFIWLYAFLELVCRYRSKTETLITGAVFVLGYNIKFFGIQGNVMFTAFVITIIAVLVFWAFRFSADLMLKWNNFISTLIYPTLWLLIYLFSTLLRLPSVIRIDMMFSDMYILIQSEKALGSIGFSFALLWTVSIIRYAITNRKFLITLIGVVIYLAMLIPGIIHLFPNKYATDVINVGYTTGPYIGRFDDFTEAPYEKNVESIKTAVSDAVIRGAEILVFNEEAFGFADTYEEEFTALCSELAAENGLPMLVGLDIRDTDGSEGGKNDNKLIFIDGNGEILGDYSKTYKVPFVEDGYKKGDGEIHSHLLEINGKKLKIAYLICYDSNFPMFVRGIDDDTDILFLPSWDWSEVTDLHTLLCRAIAAENNVTIIKPTYDGKSVAIDDNGKIFHMSDTSVTGFENIQTVEVPIRRSLVTFKSVKRLSAFTYAGIGMEIMSIVLMIILLIGNIILNNDRTKISRLFNYLLVTNAIGTGADALSWILDGSMRLELVVSISTTLSLVFAFIIIGVFIAYLNEYINMRRFVTNRASVLNWIYTCLAILFTLIISYTGDLFTITNGAYMDGPLYPAYVGVSVGSAVIAFIIVIIYRGLLEKYERIVAYAYILIPASMALLNIFFEEWSFAYPAYTVSIVLIYVKLQSEKVERIEHEGKIVRHYAMHDELTGLNNRRAYRQCIDTLSHTVGNSGVIFSDVNGLKYVNDNFGHEAGDKYLTRFGEILASVFRLNEIYRISGDEFVCIMENVDENVFNERIKELNATLKLDERQIACFGAAYGSNFEIEQLLKTAETTIYAEKTVFHVKYPETKRL
ncbi:MAG: diguanylate cyclase [Eubacteriales bacterium]|nr:diguanylate cyclase [Eubacteriales bacterium]